MLKRTARSSVVLMMLLLLPSAVYAQAAITGVVKDTSGAILPGVTVEAASPALIEKVRSVVTDGTGQYRIVDLRPGVYSLTFALPGFSTVRREGVELSGSFVATVNGDMRVGALEETITVTGETPIVDVQSVKQQQTISKEVMAAIPTSRMASSIQALIPGMSLATDVGGSGGNFSGSAGAIHGGRGSDSRSLNDGLDTAFNLTSGGMFMANVGGAQEVVISTSGGLGEAETAGAVINVIPRDGSNTFSGSVFGAFSNGSMQGNNYTQALKDAGLTTPPNQIIKNYDVNPMGGGRIVRDRLWFYITGRRIVADNTVTGMYFNKNANDITKWTYEPDLERQAFFDQMQQSATARLTWQVTPRNKINVYWDEQAKCFGCTGGGSATLSPEGQSKQWNHPSHVQQATWSSPVTNRVLFEAGFGTYMLTYRSSQPRVGFNYQIIRAQEQAGIIPGLAYRAPANYSHAQTNTRSWRASMSYVTGAHSMKFGYFGGLSSPTNTSYWFVDGITSYRFSSGVANQFTMNGDNPATNARNLVPNSLYAQDQWTTGKLTLQGGVRWDHMVSSYPEFWGGGTKLVPVPIVYPSRSVEGVGWDDITTRMGAAYDLFGNGKTAVKVNLGKYVVAGVVETGDPNPSGRLNFSTTRSWTDTNKNYVPDCVLTNPAKNAECGAMANQNFGKDVFSTTFDPEAITGWGTRAYNWELGTTVQHELIPRVSVNVGYFRRWFGNFAVTDNRLAGPSDYNPFSVAIAADPRLPNGGGTTVSDLYDLNPNKFGQVDNYVTRAINFGDQIENWHGVDVSVNARLQNGLTISGGTSTGRRLTDNCDVVPKVDSPSKRFCRVEAPYQTQIKGFASYLLPRVAVQISATLQSGPGLELAANYTVPNALVAPSLGRSLSGGANTSVNLVAPSSMFGKRLNQVDIRFAKIIRTSRTRMQFGFDIFNAANSGVPRGHNMTYTPGGTWLTPTEILTARFAKVSASVDF